MILYIFFFNDTATTEIYTLSLHDALPILERDQVVELVTAVGGGGQPEPPTGGDLVDGMFERRCRDVVAFIRRSEEHTSELQSRQYLVCRLLLEKKKKK